MKVHIVGANESLNDIARKYDILIEDIIKNSLIYFIFGSKT